ncbi:MAG TPA: helix-turn-helix domain-containing protein [Burkholderiaceae bacterium]|nr:helix-turn-helix domain-containing protein [Burkholderiaceae bacterium]
MDGRSTTGAPKHRHNIPVFSIRDIRALLRLDGHERPPQMVEADFQFYHRRIGKGGAIYRQGQPFESLYIVRLGFLKTVMRDVEGTERVLSFPMKGNMLGFDGVWKGRYGCEAVALTDCQLIVIPFNQLLATDHACRELERLVYIAISREFSEEHAAINMLNQLKAEARVARFLEELARRYAALGYSSKVISLPMTRRDIGCYLGLSLETVSRSLSMLASTGLIRVHRKNVTILEDGALRQIRSPHNEMLTGC